MLENLALLFGCQYLSDLRGFAAGPREVELIRSLSETAYSLREYQDAARYITDEAGPFRTAKEAKEAIIHKLTKNGAPRIALIR